jgi:hypothetical protein
MTATAVDRLGRRRRHYGNGKQRRWTRELVLERVHNWHAKYSEPPRSSDWDPTRIKMLVEKQREKTREWELRASTFNIGDYPSRRTVNELFGSWNAMILDAGLQPRAPGQRTPRAVEPSPFLLPLGNAVSFVYEAEDTADDETLIVALRKLEAVARKLRREIEGRHE